MRPQDTRYVCPRNTSNVHVHLILVILVHTHVSLVIYTHTYKTSYIHTHAWGASYIETRDNNSFTTR